MSDKVKISAYGKGLITGYESLQSSLDTSGLTECRNILINRQHHFEPRTPDNLKRLHAYVRRRYKTKNIFDRRTKAWRYLKSHDSEAARVDER